MLYLLAVVPHERMRAVKEACCWKQVYSWDVITCRRRALLWGGGITDEGILAMTVLSSASQQSFLAVQCESLTCYCASVAVNFLFNWNCGISFAWTFHPLLPMSPKCITLFTSSPFSSLVTWYLLLPHIQVLLLTDQPSLNNFNFPLPQSQT